MGRPESRRELCRTPPPGAGNTTSFGNSVFAGVNEDGGSDEAQARDPRGPPGLEGKGRAFGGGVALGHLGVRPLTFSLWR